MFVWGTAEVGLSIHSIPQTFKTGLYRDMGANADLRYWVHEDGASYFHIDSLSGIITAKVVFDREEVSQLKFRVLARDRGKPSRTSITTMTVNILDVNDEYPEFRRPSYVLSVLENEPTETLVGVVEAEDTDDSPYNQFTYSLLPNHLAVNSFAINKKTGQIKTKR